MLRSVSHLGRVRALGFSRARAASTIPVYSPRDGKVFTEIPDATVADVEAAVEAAASVQASGWSKADAVDQRAESLLGIAAALTERKDELAELESQVSDRIHSTPIPARLEPPYTAAFRVTHPTAGSLRPPCLRLSHAGLR